MNPIAENITACGLAITAVTGLVSAISSLRNGHKTDSIARTIDGQQDRLVAIHEVVAERKGFDAGVKHTEEKAAASAEDFDKGVAAEQKRASQSILLP